MRRNITLLMMYFLANYGGYPEFGKLKIGSVSFKLICFIITLDCYGYYLYTSESHTIEMFEPQRSENKYNLTVPIRKSGEKIWYIPNLMTSLLYDS